VRGGVYQHRQQLGGVVRKRALACREPPITLRRIAGLPEQPLRRIDLARLGSQPLPVLSEPRDRPCPPNTFSDRRRTHMRVIFQQLPDPVARRGRSSSAPRAAHSAAAHPTRPPSPRSYAKPPASGLPRLRNPLRNEPEYQRPVLQSDHSPIVECHFSSADNRRRGVCCGHRRHAPPVTAAETRTATEGAEVAHGDESVRFDHDGLLRWSLGAAQSAPRAEADSRRAGSRARGRYDAIAYLRVKAGELCQVNEARASVTSRPNQERRRSLGRLRRRGTCPRRPLSSQT
jgi:hypothetical protein